METDDKNTTGASATTTPDSEAGNDSAQTLDDGGAAGALDDPNAVGNETGPGAGGD